MNDHLDEPVTFDPGAKPRISRRVDRTLRRRPATRSPRLPRRAETPGTVMNGDIRSRARRVWTRLGLDCAMVDTRMGFVNGYVRIPEGHAAHGAGYDQINRTVRVHGGLTYGTDSEGWVGFDTGHGGDYWPGMDDRFLFGPAERTWDLERLAAEVESLAEQIVAMDRIETPREQWDCTEAEFRVLRRQALAWRRISGAAS